MVLTTATDSDQPVWRVTVNGVVQGVGFRPFVYRLAKRHRIAGWVLNSPAGVEISAQGTAADLAGFVASIKDECPPLAHIIALDVEEGPATPRQGDTFEVKASHEGGSLLTRIPPDSHVCGDCLAEMRDPGDRRHRYPFINCTNCGPRFSLIRGMPYDRPQTTMRTFIMCAACQAEYDDPGDRRYHAQPNACPVCGPRLFLVDRERRPVDTGDPIRSVIDALLAGQIVAMKSVGGFHLAVNALDDDAVALLRRRKRRDWKPFALMSPDVETIRRFAELTPGEAELLDNPARPIVLLRRLHREIAEAVAPRSPNLGFMLPSAPLHYLLFEDAKLSAIVMTSGNISGRPICYGNEQALAELPAVADLILHHDRDIETRVDDSVVRLSAYPGLKRPLTSVIRRSRGYAPTVINLPQPTEAILAFGAELKTTIALSRGREVFISQHIGDLKNDDTFSAHQECARHLCELNRAEPRVIACDMHPAFRATRFALDHADKPISQVQHHHAHMAACMAENGLTGRTLGVIFDGAGYGLDGTIWGGEFLVGDCASFVRAGHIRPILLLGNDAAVREPIRVAAALFIDAFGSLGSPATRVPALGELSNEQRHVFDVMARRRLHATPASSMGRLFDGVASLIGLCSIAEYEAHGPLELEGLMQRDLTLAEPFPYELEAVDARLIVDHRPMVRALVHAILAGTPAEELSRRFHSTMVDTVVRVCRSLSERHATRQVVLSGGVFLNEFVLVNSLLRLRQSGFDAYCHDAIPTNDGGISFGQIAVTAARLSAQQHGSSMQER